MADTGEPYNVARRKVKAAAAGRGPEGEDRYQLIEVEVGTDARPPDPTTGKLPDRPPSPRHFETFWGRWAVAPDPGKLRMDHPGYGGNRSVYYGIAQTRRGRIAVYSVKTYPGAGPDDRCWEGELNDYDTLAAAEIPEDIRRQAAAALDVREVIHRDI